MSSSAASRAAARRDRQGVDRHPRQGRRPEPVDARHPPDFRFVAGRCRLHQQADGSVLGHKTDITSSVYMALGDQTRREAIDAHAALMREARKPKKKRKTKAKKSAKVIPFPRRAAR